MAGAHLPRRAHHCIPTHAAVGTIEPFPDFGGVKPRYQSIADDLMERFSGATRSESLRRLPTVEAIAQHYKVPIATAHFVRRAVHTRLRMHTPMPRTAVRPTRAATYLYEAIADEMRDQILSGTLNGRLPARRTLAARYGVSMDVMSRASKLLAAEGLLVTAGVHGTHVLSPTGVPPSAEGAQAAARRRPACGECSGRPQRPRCSEGGDGSLRRAG